MADRRYQPGKRRTPQQRGTGKMSDSRYAWVKVAFGDLVIIRYNMTQDADNATGPTVRLHIPRPGARDLSLNFTALTEQELDKVEEFFALLFKTARPVIQDYDREAARALEEGDDSFARSYRPDAQLIVREGKSGQHSEGIRNRPQDASDGVGPSSDPDGGSGGDRSDVASREPSEPEPTYDWPSSDQPPSF